MKRNKWNALKEKILRQRASYNMRQWINALVLVLVVFLSLCFIGGLVYSSAVLLWDTPKPDIYIISGIVFVFAVVLAKKLYFPGPA